MTIPLFVNDCLKNLDLSLPEAQLGKLEGYLNLLLEANNKVNLTAVRDYDLAWRRLIIDSLTPLSGLENLPSGAKVIDIGTGGGMPGLPLAICREDLQFTLLDSTGKKIKLINQWIKALGLKNVSGLQNRAEALAHDNKHRQRYDVAISRAVGTCQVALEYMMPFVNVGGRALLMKGPKAHQELVDSGDALDKLGAGDIQVFDAYPQMFENDLVIVSVLKDRPTPEIYPRAIGIPRQNPL